MNRELENLQEALELVSGKWTSLLIYILSHQGKMGFNDLKNNLDISGKVLNENLDRLEEEDIVNKKILSESPKRVSYSLSSTGEALVPVLEDMAEWGDRFSQRDGFNVLVVDDEESLADMYGKWISDVCSVETAYGGYEALDKVDGDIDLVFLDRMMPDISGETVLKKIKPDFDCSVVLLTAKNPEKEIASMDIDGYMTKPVTREDITEKVNKMKSLSVKRDVKRNLKAEENKKQILDENFSDSELEEDTDYRKLVERISKLENKV